MQIKTSELTDLALKGELFFFVSTFFKFDIPIQ